MSLSLSDVIEKYTGVKTFYRKNTVCPLCGQGQNSPCFGIYKDKNGIDKFKCFSEKGGCAKQGNKYDFVVFYKDLADAYAAAKDICEEFGLEYTDKILDPEYEQYIQVMKEVANYCSFFYHCTSLPPLKFFEHRGLSQKVVERYMLGYYPPIVLTNDSKVKTLRTHLINFFPSISLSELESYNLFDVNGEFTLAGRFIIPFRDSYGNIIGFVGRSVDPDEPVRYKNMRENKFFSKGKVLFNWHMASKYKEVIVVEGMIDCLTLVTAGVYNVVALLGTGFSDEQNLLLEDHEIILALDSDQAGMRAMRNIIQSRRDQVFHVILIPEGKDFNEAWTLGENVEHLCVPKKRIIGPEYLIRYSKEVFDLSLLEERKKFWIELATLIGANDPRYFSHFPINTLYTPIEYDYFWKIFKRLFKKNKKEVKNV